MGVREGGSCAYAATEKASATAVKQKRLIDRSLMLVFLTPEFTVILTTLISSWTTARRNGRSEWPAATRLRPPAGLRSPTPPRCPAPPANRTYREPNWGREH